MNKHNHNDSIHRKRDLERENVVLRAQVETLERMLEKVVRVSDMHNDAAAALRKMSMKQHAALQMLMRGASNQEIAERFGVTESTAKVYVRCIMGHVGARTRAQVVAKMLHVLEEIGEGEYFRIAGIPKGWDMHWEEYTELNDVIFEKRKLHDVEIGGA